MISAHIARELDGSLEGRNRPEGGAAFVLELPLAAESAHG
jgi:C4-dicarboxylate-specific signal transduction histidine kinase